MANPRRRNALRTDANVLARVAAVVSAGRREGRGAATGSSSLSCSRRTTIPTRRKLMQASLIALPPRTAYAAGVPAVIGAAGPGSRDTWGLRCEPRLQCINEDDDRGVRVRAGGVEPTPGGEVLRRTVAQVVHSRAPLFDSFRRCFLRVSPDTCALRRGVSRVHSLFNRVTSVFSLQRRLQSSCCCA